MQLDRAKTGAAGQIYHHKLPAAFGQRQPEDEAVRPDCHRFNTGAAWDIDRRGGESVRRAWGGSATRYPAGDDCDESRKADDKHYAHDNNQDLEPAHFLITDER